MSKQNAVESEAAFLECLAAARRVVEFDEFVLEYIKTSRIPKIQYAFASAKQSNMPMDTWEHRYWQDVPCLVAEVERLRAEIARIRGEGAE